MKSKLKTCFEHIFQHCSAPNVAFHHRRRRPPKVSVAQDVKIITTSADLHRAIVRVVAHAYLTRPLLIPREFHALSCATGHVAHPFYRHYVPFLRFLNRRVTQKQPLVFFRFFTNNQLCLEHCSNYEGGTFQSQSIKELQPKMRSTNAVVARGW